MTPKFRAWDKCRNKMVLWEDYPFAICEEIAKQMPASIIMQFTGLQDKNGKDIYEGDTIRATHERQEDHPLAEELDDGVWIGEVYYAKAGYRIQTGGKYQPSLSHYDIVSIEVIGNKYEVPKDTP